MFYEKLVHNGELRSGRQLKKLEIKKKTRAPIRKTGKNGGDSVFTSLLGTRFYCRVIKKNGQ